MANDIPQIQNEDASLRVLATQRGLYTWAKKVSILQLVVVIALPAVLVVLDSFFPTTKVWPAFVGIVVAVLDAVVIDPGKNSLREKAATMQELFDCKVLDLEWPALMASKPDREDVLTTVGSDNVGPLKDWYPTVAGALSLSVARIVCQRSNCWWDGKLRRYYRWTIIGFGVVAILCIVISALILKLSFEDFVLALLAPILPALLWGAREAKDQHEAADRIDRLKTFGDQLWEKALGGTLNEEELRQESRLFQNEIYRRRQRSPMVLNSFYSLFRRKFEVQMQQSADEMVADAQANGLG
jgi:hypothetical protein